MAAIIAMGRFSPSAPMVWALQTCIVSPVDSDGAYPYASLIISGNTLYGTVQYGGSSGNGTVFAINTDGTDFTNLHSFTAVSNSFSYYANGDGANPYGKLILSGNTLYGTTYSGGTNGNGTIFAVSTNGTEFTNLYSFTGGNDGGGPEAGLILLGNTLYGTANFGGLFGYGTVFGLSLPLPQLTINPLGNNLIVSWPLSTTGFILQTNGNLGTTNWGNYGGPVINNSVTDSLPTRTTYSSA